MPMSEPSPNPLHTALQAVDAARRITKKYFRSDLEVDSKQDKSPVTIADQETEMAMKKLILDAHPDHGFFGEETGNYAEGFDWRWIIDPIDGTKSFATGKPTFGTLVALLHKNTPNIGIIDHAILDERWVGVKDQPTTFNGKPCHTSQVNHLEEATLYTTTIDMFNESGFEQYNNLAANIKFRAFGGDCYCYGLLAAGFTDIVCEADLKPYDFLAIVPVIEGAGGIISDWQGNSLTLDSGDQVLATANQQLHDAALEKLNQ